MFPILSFHSALRPPSSLEYRLQVLPVRLDRPLQLALAHELVVQLRQMRDGRGTVVGAQSSQEASGALRIEERLRRGRRAWDDRRPLRAAYVHTDAKTDVDMAKRSGAKAPLAWETWQTVEGQGGPLPRTAHAHPADA